MKKNKFKKIVDYMVSFYEAYLNHEICLYLNKEDDIWVTCPKCGESLLYEDWKNSKELLNGCCPICKERIIY